MMSEPTTAAGRALDDDLVERFGLVPRFTDAILAIEAEARAAALDEARAAADTALFDLEGQPSHPGIRAAYRRAVMTAIDALRERSGEA